MTLQELITDLKAAGANENTMQLAMNCYQIGRMEVVYAHTNETVQTAIAIEREACAKVADQYHIPMCETFADVIAAEIRQRGTQ